MKQSIRNKLIKIDDKLLSIFSVRIRNAFLDRIMPKITRCNDYGQVYILFAVITLLENSFTAAFDILLALAFGLISGEGFVKYLFKRRRPLTTETNYKFLIRLPGSFSFPSGHTTSSFAVLGVTWYMNLKFKYLILALAILISFSRVYLHVHFPSDIAGGIILGFICSVIAIKFSAHIELIKPFAVKMLSKLVFSSINPPLTFTKMSFRL